MPVSAEPEVSGHGLSPREKAAQALEPLVQVVPEEKRRLTGFILLALAAHVILFAGIQLTYPKSTYQPAPRVRAMMAMPDAGGVLADGEAADRAFWNRLLDPSMLILPQDQLDADLAALRAPRPGEAVPAAAEPVGAQPPLLQPIALRDSADRLTSEPLSLHSRLSRDLQPQPLEFIFPPEAETAEGHQTQLILSGPVAARRWVKAPDLPEPATEVLPPRGTTVVRLGVDSSGEIIHALVVEGSGSATLDQLGLEAVRTGRFAPQHINAPVQAARQEWIAMPISPPFDGLSWPQPRQAPARSRDAVQPRVPSAPALGPDHLTWGEAKLFWRLREPQATPKAGPVPPASPAR